MKQLIKTILFGAMLLVAPINSQSEEVASEPIKTIEMKLDSHIFELLPTLQSEAFKNVIERAEELKQQKIVEKQMEVEMLKRAEEVRQNQIIEERIAETKRLAQIELAKTERRNIEINNNSMLFEATYYTPNCFGCSGITFAGYDVRNTIYYQGMRIVASDNNVLPLYSIIQIASTHESFTAIVLDKGSAIRNKKLDILVADTATANRLGRHMVQIKILRYGK